MFSDIYFRLLLEVMGKDPDIKKIPSLRLDSEKNSNLNSVLNFHRLIKSIYEQCPDSSIGLEFGRQIKPINACDFSRLIATSKDVASGLDALVEFYPRLNLKPFPLLHKNEKHISIALCFPYEKTIGMAHKRFCSETFYSFCFNLFSDVVSEPIRPVKLYLDFPKPSYASEYQTLFKCEVEFNAPLSMVMFDRSIDNYPLTSANECLHDVYLTKAHEAWQQVKRQQNFQYRTLSQLMRDFPASFNGQHLADALNISPRGLQKRLSAEGCSYSLMCQVVRKELVKVCLYQRHYELEDIAACLGFQSQASFRKFFRTHFGLTANIREAQEVERLEQV
ncbi:MAG: AraC family transcriptional regulator ligand-binding domain-containing protein [Bermanella sp.]